MSEPLIRMKNLGKYFDFLVTKRSLFSLGRRLSKGKQMHKTRWVLRNISLDVYEGDRIALIGLNGAGKTTLLRILSGIYQHSEGELVANQRPTPLFQYTAGMNMNLKVVENIYIMGAFYGILTSEIKDKVDEIIQFAELENFLKRPVRKLSSGQIQRLAFSIFTQLKTDFLAMDESISLADLSFQNKSKTYFENMMKSEKTLLMASHNFDVLEEYCPKAIWLEKGELKQFGPTSEVIAAYKEFCSDIIAKQLQ